MAPPKRPCITCGSSIRYKNRSCMGCHSAKGKAYYEKNKERTLKRQRARIIKKLYGITQEEFEARSAAQGGLCAICKKLKRLVVDHDHATGRIRGLLCTPCNAALGIFGDGKELLKVALQYLEEKE